VGSASGPSRTGAPTPARGGLKHLGHPDSLAGLSLFRLILGYARNERLRRKAGLRPRHVPWIMLLIAGVPLLAVAIYVGVFLHKFGLPPENCTESLVQPTPCACYWANIHGYKCI
jgi:hypothetical protein